MNASHVLMGLTALLLISSSAFAVDMGSRHTPNHISFDDTITLGSTGVSLMEARTQNVKIPRAQVFFSQYRYVVGYHGITWLVDDLRRPDTTQQFGQPLAVYVSDYSGTPVELTDQGYIRLPNHPGEYDRWVVADDATFVVGSRARTPTGPAVIAFSDTDDARDFAETYGGSLHSWSAVREMEFDTASATDDGFVDATTRRSAWANRTVENAFTLLERPRSVVVGQDAPTIQSAVDQAPPNTTVYVPAGTYEANVTITKPITLRGAGEATHLRGDNNSSVITVHADHVAISGLRITGVGNTTSMAEPPENATDWDVRVQQSYAFGDAGVVFHRANDSLVHDIAVDTPANGIVFRWSDRSVAHHVRVNGSDTWQEGFMGVMTMASRIVVQHSTFDGGRDGVYTHRADGIVVRHNRMTGLRFGVHEMYTMNALVQNNTVRDADVGLVVMTRPTGNIIVGNDVRRSNTGTIVSGSASWVVDNVFVDNRVGMYVSARRSRYESNVVAYNKIGLRASSIIPTSQVVDNDVVGNDRVAIGVIGPLRIWSGNYWSTAPGVDADGDGTLDRPFQPTGPVDSRIGRVPGADTLATSPAVETLRRLQSIVPGLRGTGVVDPEPRARPVHPEVIESLNTTRT